MIVMVEDAANPVPETVTVVPPMPFAGLREIADVTVNMACPECEESVADTV